MKCLLKRHLVSLAVSFVGGAAAYLIPFFDSAQGWDTMALRAALAGALFAGTRAVLKVLVEGTGYYVRKPKKQETPV